MQREMRTVLEWQQSHATSKTINMITNKYEPQQKCRLGTISKNYWEILLCVNTLLYLAQDNSVASEIFDPLQFGPRK